MNPYWKGKENRDEEKKRRNFKIKGKTVEHSRLYIVSRVFLKSDFYWIALDWIGCLCRANSPSETMGEWCVFISLRFTHQRRKKDERTTPAATRNEVEKSSIKWKREKKTTTFSFFSHTHLISVESYKEHTYARSVARAHAHANWAIWLGLICCRRRHRVL